MTAQAQCEGKDPLSRELAREIAKRHRRNQRLAIEAYRCKVCGEWHIGSNPTKKRGKR